MLDKFLFGNKHIPEMYFGNIPVAKVYFGNTLIWEKEGYVPYDNTCSIIITGDNTTQKFSVQVMKNGEDVTSSLDHFNGWAYIVNDVLPAYRLFVHNIPYSTVITNPTEISITDLINGYKTAESITDSRYDDTKGEYHIDANQITSKAGGSFPGSGAISCQNNIVVPYTLTEDTSTNEVWMVVSQNTSDTPIEIKTIQFANNYTDQGNTSIYVIHESGVLIYKYDTWVTNPSIITKTISGVTYNYVAIDLANLSSEGAFKLKRNEKYFIRVKHANNNNNHYYYRNGGILGIVGYVKGSLGNIPHQATDISQLTYKGVYSTKIDMLDNVNAVDSFGKYTGTSDLFISNTLYKCKTSFTHRGLTNLDFQLLMMNDGELGSYNGESGSMSLGNKTYIKSGASIKVSIEDSPIIICAETDSTKIFKYTGNDLGHNWEPILGKNKFYSCSSAITVKSVLNTEPEPSTVNDNDILLFTVDVYNRQYGTGQIHPGFYQVVNKTESSYELTQLNSPLVDETNNMKAKLTELDSNKLYTYYETINNYMDLSNVNISTDHKYEVLMGA
jgi:hypothetical protein